MFQAISLFHVHCSFLYWKEPQSAICIIGECEFIWGPGDHHLQLGERGVGPPAHHGPASPHGRPPGASHQGNQVRRGSWLFYAVLGIHGILVWIRIRIPGSIPLCNGSVIRIQIRLLSLLTFRMQKKKISYLFL
jgi:hypothetical protein